MFEQAVYVATAAGADTAMDQLLNRQKKKAGRPARVSSLVFIVGTYLSANARRRGTLTDIAAVLSSLPREWLAELGHEQDGVTQDELYGFTRRLGKAADYSPLRAPHLTATQREEVRQLIQDFTLRLLQPTLVSLDRHTTYAVDSTALESFERPGTRPTKEAVDLEVEQVQANGDPEPQRQSERTGRVRPGRGSKGLPDASWGRRTSKTPGQVHDLFFGYMLHAIVVAPEPRGAKIPSQAVHLVLTAANGDCIDPTLRMVDDLCTTGMTFRHLIVDRLFSNARFSRWRARLIERGINQVAEPMKPDNEFKFRQGLPWLFGEPYCPGTPTHTLNITPEGQVPTRKEKEARIEAIERMKPYRLVRHQSLSADGTSRRGCPVGAVACPLREGSIAAAAGTTLPIITNPPAEPHAVCKANSGAILRMATPEDQVVLKLAQDPPLGTPAHQDLFDARSSVERYFSNMKWHDRFTRDITQLRGLGMMTIIATIYAGSSNVRLLEAAQERDGTHSDHTLIRIKVNAGEPLRPKRSRHQ